MDSFHSKAAHATCEALQLSMAEEKLHVGIVGAGLGGLAAAIGIARSGHKVTVLEQAAVLGEVSSRYCGRGSWSDRAAFRLELVFRSRPIHRASSGTMGSSTKSNLYQSVPLTSSFALIVMAVYSAP